MKLYLTNKDKVFPGQLHLDNFVPSEFNTGNAQVFFMNTNVLTLIQKLRNLLGVQIVINSAYRSEEYNQLIGGSKDSFHVKGMAIDFTLNSVGRKQYNILKVASILHLMLHRGNQPYGGIEIDIHSDKEGGWGYIHVDTRDDIWRAVRFAGKDYVTCNNLFGEIDKKNKASVYAWQYLVNILERCYLHIDGIYGSSTEKDLAYITHEYGKNQLVWKAMQI